MLERVLETPKNGFVSTVTLRITLNKANPGKNITNNFTKLIANIKNNNHASINYDASIETLFTAYIPIYYIKVSGIPDGNKLIKMIRYPHK